MSRYLDIGNPEPSEVSSNSGWSQFLDWINEIDAEEFPDLVQFARDGFTDKTQAVIDQIEFAREEFPPIPDVVGILDNIVSFIDGKESASVL